MRIVILALALALISSSTLWAQGSPVGPRGPKQIYNCCIKPTALDAPVQCKRMSGLDCQNMGGKIVKDCKDCK